MDIEGKGWFVIYGILLLAVVYLLFAVAGVKGDLNEVRADLAEVKEQSAQIEQATPGAEATPSAKPSAEPDLATALGRDKQRKQDLNTLADAVKAYQAARGSYPNSLNQTTPDFLEQPLRDPLSPRYTYRYRRTPSGFTLTCVLEQPGDPDDRSSDGRADKTYTVTQASGA